MRESKKKECPFLGVVPSREPDTPNASSLYSSFIYHYSGMKREARAIIHCRGHPHVRAAHPSTLEITCEHEMTPNGDCIIAVGADCSARDLPEEFRILLCRDDASLHTVFSCGGMSVEVRGQGSSSMTLDHPADMVWRRSCYVCGRTVAIGSDTTARMMPREFVEALRQGGEVVATLTVRVP